MRKRPKSSVVATRIVLMTVGGESARWILKWKKDGVLTAHMKRIASLDQMVGDLRLALQRRIS
jgi:hypothetical protein